MVFQFLYHFPIYSAPVNTILAQGLPFCPLQMLAQALVSALGWLGQCRASLSLGWGTVSIQLREFIFQNAVQLLQKYGKKYNQNLQKHTCKLSKLKLDLVAIGGRH